MWNVIMTASIGLLVAHMAFGGGRAADNLAVIKQYRPIQFLTTVFVVVAVIVTATLLYNYVPLMDKNPILWVLSWVFGWGDGTGQGNVLFFGLQWKYYAIAFLTVLFFALPSLARLEEEAYREGTVNWAQGLVRSIRFGLIHLIMLIPLGAALALSIGGLWFTYQYFKGGVERSTLYHSVYNSIIIAVIFVVVVLPA